MAKKEKIKADSPKQSKSRAKYPCPPELEEMIRMVNLVPIGTDFFSFQDEVRARDLIARQNTGQRPVFSFTAVLKDLLSKLPEEAQNFIKNRLFFEDSPDLPAPIDLDNASQNELTDLISSYTHFYYLWADILQYIIQRKQRQSERLQPIHAFIIDDSNGNEKLFGFAGLIGKFNGDRLRICEICSKVFWAKRDDSFACSEPCANALRVRRSRSLSDEQKAERKAQRDANKRYKTKFKSKEKQN